MDSSKLRSEISENVFFFVLFHRSFPLEYVFMCKIFADALRHEIPFRKVTLILLQKDSTLDVLPIFSLCYINRFLLDQLLILSFSR